jgi:hypothetical protein
MSSHLLFIKLTHSQSVCLLSDSLEASQGTLQIGDTLHCQSVTHTHFQTASPACW